MNLSDLYWLKPALGPLQPSSKEREAFSYDPKPLAPIPTLRKHGQAAIMTTQLSVGNNLGYIRCSQPFLSQQG